MWGVMSGPRVRVVMSGPRVRAGGNGHGDGVGHGKSREALEGAHGHVGGDVRPEGEGSDGHGDELPVVKVWSL